jgi:hypothetical protein
MDGVQLQVLCFLHAVCKSFYITKAKDTVASIAKAQKSSVALIIANNDWVRDYGRKALPANQNICIVLPKAKTG